MSLPTPFNSVTDLLAFCSFRQGAGGPSDTGDLLKQSAIEATFSFGQLENELQRARNYIYKRTGKKTNEQLDEDEDRKAELQEAELYLATSRLYERFAEKIASQFPEANLAAVSDMTLGADTPSPYEKMEVWHRVAKVYLQKGLALLYGQPFEIALGEAPYTSTDPYPCLCKGQSVYSNRNTTCCQYL